MTFVAGLRGFDGVLLLTDCRLTQHPTNVEWDTGQKVFCLAPQIAIAFAGDVDVAGRILLGLICKFRRWRRRRDEGRVAKMLHLLPASARRCYRRAIREVKRNADVTFMVAATVGAGAPPFSCETRLFKMKSPEFTPQYAALLRVDSIGSGAPLAAALTATDIMMHIVTAGGHGVDGPVQAANFRDRFVGKDKTGLMTGGFLPVVKVGVLWHEADGRVAIGACGFNHVFEFFDPSEVIELMYDMSQDRWLQRNRSTSKAVPLRRPWEPLPSTPTRFDDLDIAMRRKRANLSPVPGTGMAIAWHKEGASRPIPTLTVLVGLPGSGKTFHLNTYHAGRFVDDFKGRARHNCPSFSCSRFFPRLTRMLRAGVDCAISDIAFCRDEDRASIEAVLLRRVGGCAVHPGGFEAATRGLPPINIEYVFFENAPDKCRANVTERNRLEDIDKLTGAYHIPAGVAPLPVWSRGA